MKLHKYTLQELINAIENSKSIRECLSKLNVKPMGGNYDVFRKAVNHFKLDTSHFTGSSGSGATQKGKYRPKIPLSEILVEHSFYTSNNLRLRLIRECIFNHECSSCNLTMWKNLPIPLELDHVNGISTDNRLENLRLLCPNCHALTPTYRGKNKKRD